MEAIVVNQGIDSEIAGREEGVQLVSGVINRRRLLKLAGGAGVAAMLAGAIGGGTASAAGAFYRATSNVNLRNAANTKGGILLIIPNGAFVYDLGTSRNGFIKVEYDGVSGWAHGKYLAPTSSADAPQIIGISNTTRSVNFRSGPSTSHDVIAVLPKYTLVSISDTEQTGFTFVDVDGDAGWIYTEYLAGVGQEAVTLTTTSALNLRSQPKTTASVILVMPKGASVIAGDERSNGFRMVTYKSTTGWAHESYLA